MRKYIKRNAAENNISGIEFEGCYYITFKMEKVSDIQFISRLLDGVEREGIICEHLVENSEIPVFEKYDNYIPHSLLRKAYAADKLRADEAEELISEGWGPDDGDDLVEAFNFTPEYAADLCREMRKIYEEIGILVDAEGEEV